ncbi:MAG: adenylate/guanylate cyclase domain-containing protein, partial [SAR324 cluster bacterium]|nr:adenylate/guanylate cyclase domain-containing protein [SAR324 cluster bacterium]
NLGLELADSLGASRFKPFFIIFLARVRLAQKGHDPATVRLVEEALEISRQTGAGFLTPWVLSTLALVNDDPALSRRALKQGEEILISGCVGHNYYSFYRDAIEVALNNGDWEEAERYASALEAYTRPEPAPWSDFFIARGRALAAYGRGSQDDALLEELKGLREEADRVGLKLALPALEEALTAK